MLSNKTYYKKKSFTLIELLIVMALISIVLFFSAARTNFYSRFLVQSEVDKLYSICFYMQQFALLSGEQQALKFNISENSYSFCNIHKRTVDHKLPAGICFGFLPNVKGPPGKPRLKIDDVATFAKINGTPTIFFYTNGKLSVGTVYLVDKQKKFLGALTCSVSHVSYPRKYFYNKGNWEMW